MSNFRPSNSMRAVLAERKYEMDCYDGLPPELRRALADADHPSMPSDVMQHSMRIHPRYVVDLLRARDVSRSRDRDLQIRKAIMERRT